MPRLSVLRDGEEQSLLVLLAAGGLERLWAKDLRTACSAACSSEDEVAVAGVSAFLDLLNASGSVVPSHAQS
jgi:hypothetical protein